MWGELQLPERHGPGEDRHLALLLAAHEEHVERRRARRAPLAVLRGRELGPLPLRPGGADRAPRGRAQRQALRRGARPHLLELEELGEGLGGRAARLVLEHAVGRAVEHLGVARVPAVGAARAVVVRAVVGGRRRRAALQAQVVRVAEAELALAQALEQGEAYNDYSSLLFAKSLASGKRSLLRNYCRDPNLFRCFDITNSTVYVVPFQHLSESTNLYQS